MSTEILEAAGAPLTVSNALTSAKQSTQRTKQGPLIPVPTKLPAALRQQLRALADQHGLTLSAFVRTTLETAIRSAAASPSSGVEDATAKPSGRAKWSRRIGLRLALEDLRKAEAYAARTGLRKATALAEIVHLGLELAEAKEGIPGARADAILRVLHGLEALVSRLGPALLGTLVLLAFSVARGTNDRISEDELLARARDAGDDEWARIMDELTQADEA